MRIGIYLSPGKFLKPEFLDLRAEVDRLPDVTMDIINMHDPNGEYGEYDVVLHKVTDDLVHEKYDAALAADIAKYEVWCKSMVCVNPIALQRCVIDRIELAEMLNAGIPEVYLPKQVAVSHKQLIGQSKLDDIPFPAVCKTAQACGCSAAHSMAVVHDEASALDALRRISDEYITETGHDCEFTVILQEYVPHDGVVHKVYVLGDHVWVQRRGSISPETEFFHSHKIGAMHDVECLSFSQSTAEIVAKSISESMGMTIFGFDVLIDTKGGVALIDVNYFPGFKGVESFSSHLVEYLRRVVAM